MNTQRISVNRAVQIEPGTFDEVDIIEADTDQRDWMKRAIELLPVYPGSEGSAEDLKRWLYKKIGQPHHHGVIGNLIKLAVKRNILQATGANKKALLPESRARRSPIYRLTNTL